MTWFLNNKVELMTRARKIRKVYRELTGKEPNPKRYEDLQAFQVEDILEHSIELLKEIANHD